MTAPRQHSSSRTLRDQNPSADHLPIYTTLTDTIVKDARHQQFDFLGYAFGPQKLRRDGHVYLAASPSRKSVQRLKDKIGMMLTAGDKRPCEEVVTDLNRVLRGWANYFSHGTRMPAFRAIDHHVYDRMRNFLAKRHKVETRGTRRFSSNFIFGELGVLRLKRDHFGPRPTALR
jgi:RNA-directed DNA polymerase